MDRPLKLGCVVSKSVRQLTFQSLFWWIGLSNGLGIGEVREHSVSFNPCSGGSASQTSLVSHTARIARRVSILVLVDRPLKQSHGHVQERIRIVSILVLVDRPLKPPPQSFRNFKHRKGFNPCSGGSASQTLRRSEASRIMSLFQSLFWWIGLSNSPLASHQSVYRRVSILVLVDRPLKPSLPVASWRAGRVSILVLVDRPLKPSRAAASWVL